MSKVELSAEEALWLLECVSCAYSESYAPQVGDHKADIDQPAANALVERLAALAGVNPDRV